MIHFNWYKFHELTVVQLYAVLALRSEVFVVEQSCVYLDLDGKDQNALHLLGTERNKGYGKQLIHEFIDYVGIHFPKTSIECSAQLYLKHFYEEFGFEVKSEPFDEDKIPHIIMSKRAW